MTTPPRVKRAIYLSEEAYEALFYYLSVHAFDIKRNIDDFGELSKAYEEITDLEGQRANALDSILDYAALMRQAREQAQKEVDLMWPDAPHTELRRAKWQLHRAVHLYYQMAHKD